MTTLIKYTIFLCYAMLIIEVSALWEEIAGPYDIALGHLAHCDKRGPVSFFEPMKASKFNRTHFAYTGLLNVAVDLDDNAKFKVVASNKGTNGRYNNVIDIEMKACDIIEKLGKQVISSMFENCNRTYECPMKSFTCEMRNWLMNYNIMNVPALPYGEYRMDVSILKIHQYNKKELICCTRFYGYITPKMPKIQKKTNMSSTTNHEMT